MTAVRPSVLVAGVGNVFLGDDGFGVEVAARLRRRHLPDGVEVADFGIRGFDLAYALMDGYDAAILVDAMPLGREPGSVAVVEPDLSRLEGPALVQGHAMEPVEVLHIVRDLGGRPPPSLLLVGWRSSRGWRGRRPRAPNGGRADGVHEIGLCEGVLAVALEAAGEDRVARVRMRAGRRHGIVPESVELGWRLVTEGTAAEGSVLEVVDAPGEQLVVEEVGLVGGEVLRNPKLAASTEER